MLLSPGVDAAPLDCARNRMVDGLTMLTDLHLSPSALPIPIAIVVSRKRSCRRRESADQCSDSYQSLTKEWQHALLLRMNRRPAGEKSA